VLLLKTLAMSPQQLEQQKSKSKPPKPSFGQGEATILQKAVQLKQSQYDTSISQDQEHLASFSQSGAVEGSRRRQKMAVQVRVGEKEILHSLSGMLDSSANVDDTAKRNANGDGPESRKTKAQKT
jgi:SET domain-containing protein 6